MIRMYPPVPVVGKSFKGVKRCTVPNQSLSLREIVKRFVRRESLPISKEGLYETRFGDLEKLSHADITEKLERVEELKAQIKAFNDRQTKIADDARAAKEKADRDAFEKAVTDRVEGVHSDKGNTDQKSPPKGA